MPHKKYKYNDNDYEFMHSLSSALLNRSPKGMSTVLYFWLFSIIIFIVWASFAEIDEITRGSGKVIPYGENQVIQNLEGGIVEAILVNEGDKVKAGQVVLRIKNSKSRSSFETNRLTLDELQAKVYRLQAEASERPYTTNTGDTPAKLLEMEKSLYTSNMTQFRAQDEVIVQQIEQRKHELKEAKNSLKHLKNAYILVNEEVKMTRPMVKEGVKSKVDFLRLQRDLNDIAERLENTKLSIPRLQSAIKEARQKREENHFLFKNTAKKELNQVSAEITRIKANKAALTDQIDRTIVHSLVDGIVQKLFIHTIGGVIKPGEDLIEIVPSDNTLYAEVQIKPSDIAFIHPGAEAMVKFSAYDFAIHGGLKGEVTNISPDTITDEKGNTFYRIHIKTTKNHLGSDEHPLKIITGMTVNVDIVTGKKTVMQYILKPILKSKQYVFSER